MIPTVDGADNRDNHYGGPLMSFSTESLEQFQLATSQFTAADGRTGGAAVTMVTKSGHQRPSRLGIRVRARSRVDLEGLLHRAERRREGALQPAAVRRIDRRAHPPEQGVLLRRRRTVAGGYRPGVPDVQFNELEALVTATRAGQVPAGLVNLDHPRFGPQPGTLRMISVKSNIQLNNDHSLMARLATQKDKRDAVAWITNNDMREEESSEITAQSGVVQHSWVMGNSQLNQVTAQVNHMNFLGDSFSNITGEHYIRDFPNVDIFPPRLQFPTVDHRARRRRRHQVQPLRDSDQGRLLGAERFALDQARRQLQQPAEPRAS